MSNQPNIRPGDTVTCTTLQFSGNWVVDELIPDKNLAHLTHAGYHCWVDLDEIRYAEENHG